MKAARMTVGMIVRRIAITLMLLTEICLATLPAFESHLPEPEWGFAVQSVFKRCLAPEKLFASSAAAFFRSSNMARGVPPDRLLEKLD
jgi:hypothetical protein